MICPSCYREVSILQGNGTYPNSSWKCGFCHDEDTGKAVAGFFKAVFIIAVILTAIAYFEPIIREIF